jgi:ribosomal-protein-alanine N-acetyltransferase
MPASPVILETGRLILRPVEAADIPALVDLWSDPQVTEHMGGPRQREKLARIFAETAQDPLAERYDMYPVVEKSSGKVVGHCGLLDKEVDGKTEIELVYVLARDAWGLGYATEIARAIIEHAFWKMGVERLIALIEPRNTASERVARKIGMRLEKEVLRPGGSLRRVYVVERSETLQNRDAGDV